MQHRGRVVAGKQDATAEEPGHRNQVDGDLGDQLAPIFARGFRAALVTGATAGIDTLVGPAVIVVDAAGQVIQASIGADEWVSQLGGGTLGESPLPLGLRNLVGAARTYAAGRHTQMPRMRLRTRSGGWVVAHASPLMSVVGSSVNVVLTIEETRPPDVIPLIVAAYGLSPREQAVVQLVLRGVSTAEIAAALHLSAYTVQDHLKSIFEKADVRSRRDLTARVFFDQYAPRIGRGSPLAPSGWFTPEPAEASQQG
jgi:DNA-binding CsgD family transcriptional regulator